MRPLLALIITATAAFAQLPAIEPFRSWTAADGRTFDAALTAFDGTTVSLRMKTGAPAQTAAAKLSPADQKYLTDWRAKQPIKFNLPDIAGVETAAIKIEVIKEDDATSTYIYRTAHFDFESQGKFNQTLLREIARNFEATYELVRALPWGVVPRPAEGTHFKARLLRDKAAYHAAGGPPNSGGVYMSRNKTFMVPFESIGIKEVGKAFAKDDDFQYDTLVHELTHQMMHFWLDPLPQWVVEGTAEYTGNLPLRTGKFRVSAAKGALKDYVTFLRRRAVGGIPEPYPIEQLFTITNQQWGETLATDPGNSRRMYFTSYLLVYYFMHLDGAGDGQRFIRYFRAVGEAVADNERYAREMAEFFKNPKVTKQPDGRYSWSGIEHPKKPALIADAAAEQAFQKKTLEILLDGRSVDELLKQIRTAYNKLGIRL